MRITHHMSPRKRKKQFKYLLDKGNASPEEADNDEKESRKKVKKACIFCKRSHMPCEQARPCQRCVKRGISDKCRDAEPSTETTESKSSSKQRDDSPSSHFCTPGASAPDPDFTPLMPISVLLSPAVQDTKRNSQAPIFVKDPKSAILSQAKQLPNAKEHQALACNHGLNLASHTKLLGLLEAGPSALDLSDVFGDKPTFLLSAPSMAGLQVGDPLLMNMASNTPKSDEYIHERPRHLVQEEQATTAELRGTKPYSYTYGYAKLARWIQTRYSRAACEAVDRSLSILRPKLLAISQSLAEPELVAVEEAFIRLVHHYQANVLEFIPVPMIITRRTGEIYGGNQHAATLLGVHKSLFEGGKVSHFQFVDEESSVALWNMYVSECMGTQVDPPCGVFQIEVDRSLLLYNRPAFDPRTGDVFADECEDGYPAVIRKKVLITFEAKISQHGLPIMVCATFATFATARNLT